MPANALAEDHLLTLNVLKAADLDSAILRSGQGTVVSDVLELLPHGQVFLQDVAISVGVRVGLAVVENRLGLFSERRCIPVYTHLNTHHGHGQSSSLFRVGCA